MKFTQFLNGNRPAFPTSSQKRGLLRHIALENWEIGSRDAGKGRLFGLMGKGEHAWRKVGGMRGRSFKRKQWGGKESPLYSFGDLGGGGGDPKNNTGGGGGRGGETWRRRAEGRPPSPGPRLSLRTSRNTL